MPVEVETRYWITPEGRPATSTVSWIVDSDGRREFARVHAPAGAVEVDRDVWEAASQRRAAPAPVSLDDRFRRRAEVADRIVAWLAAETGETVDDVRLVLFGR